MTTPEEVKLEAIEPSGAAHFSAAAASPSPPSADMAVLPADTAVDGVAAGANGTIPRSSSSPHIHPNYTAAGNYSSQSSRARRTSKSIKGNSFGHDMAEHPDNLVGSSSSSSASPPTAAANSGSSGVRQKSQIPVSGTKADLRSYFFKAPAAVARKGASSHACARFCHSLMNFGNAVIIPFVIAYRVLIDFLLVNLLYLGGEGGARRTKFFRAVVAWLILAMVALYGWYAAYKACNFDLDNGSGGSACFGDTSKVLLAVARSSGKLITFTLLTGLIVCNKLVTSAYNEVSDLQKHSIDWRAHHMLLIFLSVLLSIIHGIAHIERRAVAEISYGYEVYELVTGIVLWVLFLLEGLPTVILKLDEKVNGPLAPDSYSCRKRVVFLLKKMFRVWHVILFYVFCFVFCIHAYVIWPLLICLFWKMALEYHRINCESSVEILYVNPRTGEPISIPDDDDTAYHMIITATMKSLISGDFGTYIYVVVDGVTGAYTMIPKPDPDTGDCHSFQVEIAKSVLTEKIRSIQREPTNIEHLYRRNNDKHYTLPIGTLSMELFGPFHSTNSIIRNGKHLVVLTAGAGKTVADSVLNFSRFRSGYWSTVTVLHVVGRDKEGKDYKRDTTRVEAPWLVAGVADLKLLLTDTHIKKIRWYGEVTNETSVQLFAGFNELGGHLLICGKKAWYSPLKHSIRQGILQSSKVHFEEFGV